MNEPLNERNESEKENRINPFSGDNILELSKLKAFASDKFNVDHTLNLSFEGQKTLCEKEKNAGYQHFLLSPQCFQKPFSSGASKGVIV